MLHRDAILTSPDVRPAPRVTRVQVRHGTVLLFSLTTWRVSAMRFTPGGGRIIKPLAKPEAVMLRVIYGQPYDASLTSLLAEAKFDRYETLMPSAKELD